MTKDEAIAQVQRLLGFRQDGATSIEALLISAQHDLEDNWQDYPHPWFLISEEATTSTVALERRVAKPSTWLAGVEDSVLEVLDPDTSTYLPLQKYDDDDLKLYYSTYDPAFPVAYSEDGLYFRMYPTPLDVYTLRMKFYERDTSVGVLTGAQTNRWLTYYPNALIGKAGMLYGGASNNSRTSIFSALFVEAINAIKVKNLDIQIGNRRMAMGETL